MVLFVLVVLALGYVAFAYFHPQQWDMALTAIAVALALLALLITRRHVRRQGGFGLWWRLASARLRPALSKRAKSRKAENIVRAIGAIDDAHRLRQRDVSKHQQHQLRDEVRKIGEALAPLRESYGAHAFVDFHYLDNGACFCVTDDQPYAHQDVYAILAEVEDHRRWHKKVFYTVRKGQMLEDREVFPAHTSPPRFKRLNKAHKILRNELPKVIDEIASRDPSPRQHEA